MPMKHWFAGVAVCIALLGAVDAQAGPGDALGPPFLVSPSSGFTPPQLARDAAGNFLLLWGNQARRYYANGTPQGAEFPILPGDLRYVYEPAVAMGAAGDYVVAWRAYVAAENLFHVYARSYDASGLARSPRLDVARLPKGVDNNSSAHSVAMAPDGRFVVTWRNFVSTYLPLPPSSGGAFFGYGNLHARGYALDGSSGTGDILVDTSLTSVEPVTGLQSGGAPRAAMDALGNFVLVWEDNTALGSTVLFMRRYAAGGKAAGLKTRVNPVRPLEAYYPAVAMDHAGGYLIGWQVRHFTSGLNSSGHDVWARRYSAAGKAQGDAFQVNADGEVSVYDRVSVALDPDGDAAIAWGGSWDRTNLQRYSAAGLPQGGKTLVSTPGVRITSAPAVALDAYGNAVVAWHEVQALMARLYQAY